MNPLQFVVAKLVHLNPMVVGKEGAYGVSRVCLWGGGLVLTWEER